VIVGAAAMVRDQRARSSFSSSALFSEHLRGAARSVIIDQEGQTTGVGHQRGM